MTKVFMALASVLVLASASTDIASAAMVGSGAVRARGQAINECRALEKGDMNNHHARLAIKACVQRLMHGDEAITY